VLDWAGSGGRVGVVFRLSSSGLMVGYVNIET